MEETKETPPAKILTAKEEAFCNAYLLELNAAKAARLAGYSPHTAREIGYENLTKPHIQQRISELRKVSGHNYNITRERIAQELARIAFSDTRKLYDDFGGLLPPHEWPDDIAAVISGVETSELFDGYGEDRKQVGNVKKVKTWEKTKAIAELNRMMGFYEPDKQDVNHSGSLAITPITGMEIK